MSISSAITQAQQRVANAYTAINNKGGTLPQTQNLANMPTAISSIPSDKIKYGASIDNFLGNTSGGTLQKSTSATNFVFNGVANIGLNALLFKFVGMTVSSISFPDLTSITGSSACRNAFDSTTGSGGITTVSMPNLQTIWGGSACQYMFSGCSWLKTITFPSLINIRGGGDCMYMFNSCTNLETAYFPLLNYIGTWGCQAMFSGCSKITDVYFNSLTTSSFGDTGCFTGLLLSTGTSVTHTLHFPSNLQSTVEGLSGYPLFGGSSGYVTIAFDLAQTS